MIIQLNLTNKCKNGCNHCYQRETISSEISIKCDLIITQFNKLRHTKNLIVNITGGDPFLYDDLNKLVHYFESTAIEYNILGNVNYAASILNRTSYLRSYQVSYDGTINGHQIHNDENIKIINDFFSILYNRKIKKRIMLTLMKSNKNVLLDIIRGDYFKECDSITFNRVVPNMHTINELIPPNEYKQLLIELFNLILSKRYTKFYFKDNLWKLLLYEKGLYYPSRHTCGCSLGRDNLCITPNGDVLPCSKVNLTLGNINNDNITNIYYKSKIIRKLNDFSNFEKCKKCFLLYVCRGCPAIAFKMNENIFSPDPQCWLN